jgi:hypothetical protein
LTAGCTDGDTDTPDGSTDEDGGSDGRDSGSEGESDASADGSESEDEGANDTESGSRSTDDSLDLREANVVDVAFDEEDGTYSFEVSLHHDDDGEDGYANWWQIERVDGTRLGRRELTHAHSQQPFTRSETIAIPDAVDCVIVRGHDQTHGYGGLAVVVDLETGSTRTLDQGPEKQSFEPDVCPD